MDTRGVKKECAGANLQGERGCSRVRELPWNEVGVTHIEDARLRQEVVSRGHLGFMPRKGKANPVFMSRKMAEKYRERQKELHVVFIDLEKAYKSKPKQKLWRCLRERGQGSRKV